MWSLMVFEPQNILNLEPSITDKDKVGVDLTAQIYLITYALGGRRVFLSPEI